MNPLFSIALVVGAFLLGRRGTSKSKARSLPPAPTRLPGDDGPRALPPAGGHPLPPGPEGQSLEEIADRWEGVTWDVEFYPAEDGTVPPPSAKGITANADCTTIAVGVGWWDVAGEFALETGLTDPKKIYNKIVSVYLPQCTKVGTHGAEMFRAELMSRIEEMSDLPDMGFSQQQVQLTEFGQLHSYVKPGTDASFSIVMEPRKVYHPALGQTATTWDWRAWAPGPVMVGTHVRSGTDWAFGDALGAAQASIDGMAYGPSVELHMNPRRNGARARIARRTPRRRLSSLPR